MASKRKQTAASFSSKGKKKTPQDPPLPLDRDALNEHEDILDSFKERPIIPERGIILEPPFDVYFREKGWINFIRESWLGKGNRPLVNTFFKELTINPGNRVQITTYLGEKRTLDISPSAINKFFEIPPGQHDEYSDFLKSKYNVRDILLELTGNDGGSNPSLKKLKRQALRSHARFLNQLVNHRLMPVTSNPKVEEKRALLIYAISKGMTVDVGVVINRELHAMTHLRSKTQAIGFPSLITVMCHFSRIYTPTNPQDNIKLKKPLSWSLFIKPSLGASSSGTRGENQEGTDDDDEDEGEEHEEDEERAAPPNATIDDISRHLQRLDARLDHMDSRMEAFFQYQVAYNAYLACDRQGDVPFFPPPPPPPQP